MTTAIPEPSVPSLSLLPTPEEKALRQTVPEDAKTEELIDLIEWLC